MAASAQPAATKTDWPSLNDELSRKTSDQLEVWIDRYDRSVIGLATMISVVSAIYDCTSGLIDRDLSTLIADIHTDLVGQVQQKR